MPSADLKEINWLNDSLEGKYKGLEKAARIYNAALRQSIYFRLVILELMENLTSGNEEVRRNSLWMLSKIVEEQRDYKYMSPTIQILIYSIQEKNNAICYYALKIINQIVSAYYDQFKEAIPHIIENLKRSNQKIKLLTASIITQFMEVDPNAMESAIKLLTQALNDKDQEIREVAIEALLRIDQHVERVVQSIMESFNDERFRNKMIKHIFDFIKRNPGKVIEALKKTIKSKDEKIRINSIVFMHQLSLTRHSHEVIKAVPELLEAITDKNRVMRRTAIMILYLISKNHAPLLHKGIPKFIKLLKIKNKILLTYNMYILVQLIKYFPVQLNDQMDILLQKLEQSLTWDDITPELEIINTLSLGTLLRCKNQVARALNIAQECTRNYRLDRAIYEVFLFIGYTYYYLDNYSDSIQAFLKADNARKKGDYYTATIANIMIAFNFALLRLFKSCMDYAKDARKYFEVAKDQIPMHQLQKLQFHLDFIEAVAALDFDSAENILQSYHALDPVKHPFEQNLQRMDLINVKKVKKFYQESQEILSELEKEESADEPPVLRE